MKQNRILGITGVSGSGKTYISDIINKYYNVLIINADNIGHTIIKKGSSAYYEIVEHFSDTILDNEGNIIRKKLGDIVFNDNSELKILNSITHKHILHDIENIIKDSDDIILIDAALLIEIGIYKLVDQVWIVYSDMEKRLQSIIDRDGISRESAINRIDSQMSLEEYKLYSDICVYNDYTDNTVKNVKKLFNEFLL